MILFVVYSVVQVQGVRLIHCCFYYFLDWFCVGGDNVKEKIHSFGLFLCKEEVKVLCPLCWWNVSLS